MIRQGGLERKIRRPKRHLEELFDVNKLVGKIYLGKIKDNRDVRGMGRVKVWIPELSPDEEDTNGWILVSYSSPFGGATNVRNNSNENTFEGTQKAYGWWAVPPDLNVQVLVVFTSDGNTAKGFWIGCVHDEQMNFMIPGIASDDNVEPKVEYNRKVQGTGATDAPQRIAHDILKNGLDIQGLLTDTLRGINSSSSKRRGDHGEASDETTLTDHSYQPAKVYGFLSPGGHQLVLDDGYTNDDGANENSYIRFRTKNGAQILIDDNEGIVYFVSKDGKTWIEMTDQNEGNVDVYSYMNINLHAEKGSVNIKAGTDINMQAGRDWNVKVGRDTKIEIGNDLHEKVGNEIRIQSGADYNLTSDAQILQESAGVFGIQGSGDVIIAGGDVQINAAPPPSPAAPKTPAGKQVPAPGGGTYSGTENIASRVPQHEPWSIHTYKKPVRTASRRSSGGSPAVPGPAPVEGPSTVPEDVAMTTPLDGTVCGLDETQTQSLLNDLGYRESSHDYGVVNTLNYLGKYQMGAGALEDTGYLNKGATAKYSNKQDALDDPANWTGLDGVNSKEDFLANPDAQEKSVQKLMNRNCQTMRNKGIIDDNTDAATKAGYLATAHLGGVGGVEKLINGGVSTDAYGTSTDEYFNLGAGSINKLI